MYDHSPWVSMYLWTLGKKSSIAFVKYISQKIHACLEPHNRSQTVNIDSHLNTSIDHALQFLKTAKVLHLFVNQSEKVVRCS